MNRERDLLSADLDNLRYAIGAISADAEIRIASAKARIARLESDLNECLEFLEGQSDVVDGSYGEPSPNRAMQLVSMIDETLNGRPY